MTEDGFDEIHGLLVRAMSDASEPHGWAEVQRRALSLDASSPVVRPNGAASVLTQAVDRHHLETPDGGEESDRGGGRRLALVLAIAAGVVMVAAGWLMTNADSAVEIVPADLPISSTPSSSIGGATSNPTATTSSVISSPLLAFPTSVPDAPYVPNGRAISIVVLVQRDGILGAELPSGEIVPFDDEFGLPDGVLGDQRILDTASPGAGFYLILCCDPGPTLWRNGTPSAVSATRIQMAVVLDETWANVAVDDVSGTLSVSADEGNLGDRPIATVSVPGLIDAAATPERLLVLVAGDDPHLLAHDRFQPGRTFDETTLERVEVPFAGEGPCSIVPVNDDFLVLYGSSDGVDRCIGDRAALIDGSTGELVSALRLPGVSRQMNSNDNVVTVVTTDGRVLVGEFVADETAASEPEWTTIVRADAVAASVGFS